MTLIVSNYAADPDPPQAEQQISSLQCLQDQSSTNDDGVEISTAPDIVRNDLGKLQKLSPIIR